MSVPHSAPAAQQDTSIWSIIKQTAKDWSEDNAMRLAAAMACYVMLALAPLLVILVKVLGIVYGENTDKVIQAQLDQLVGPAGAQAIGEMLKNAHKSGGGTIPTLISFGIVVLSASGVFVSLQDALNTIWEVKPKPKAGSWHWVRKRFLSIGMVFGIAILLMSSMAVTAVLGQIVDGIFGAERSGFFAKTGAYVVDFITTVAVAWVLFMGVYKFLPDVKITWKDVWLGALTTAVLFKVGQIALALYFHYGAATSAYGAFGSIVAVLLWAYYSSAIVFFGAEFTQVWAKAHGRELEPEEHAEKVTEEERAQQGTPGKKEPPRQMAPPAARPYGPPLPVPLGYVKETEVQGSEQRRAINVGAAGAAMGALAAGVVTWYIATDKAQPTRKQAASVRLNQRLNAIETKLGRVSRVKHYLDRLDVKERIDNVEEEIHRAGRHLRAQETNRPMWMVRLGDLIGGRWSKV